MQKRTGIASFENEEHALTQEEIEFGVLSLQKKKHRKLENIQENVQA